MIKFLNSGDLTYGTNVCYKLHFQVLPSFFKMPFIAIFLTPKPGSNPGSFRCHVSSASFNTGNILSPLLDIDICEEYRP